MQNITPKEKPSASNGVKYILDFDGVILNIDALKAKMGELEIPLSFRTKETFQLIKEKDASFNLSSLIFSDALTFIKKHANKCVIVSSHVSVTQTEPQDEEASFGFQLEKIMLSGVKELGITDIRVVGKEKKEALADIQKEFGQQCVFVDDREQYINEAKELGLRAFFMNRKRTSRSFETLKNFESTNEIASFDELEEKLK